MNTDPLADVFPEYEPPIKRPAPPILELGEIATLTIALEKVSRDSTYPNSQRNQAMAL